MTAQHTPEPWFIDEFGDVRTSLDCYGNLIDMNLRHNKTRIVACVNACAGKTNEQLEGAAGKLFTGSAIALWSNYCDLKEKNAALSEQVAGLETQLTRAESTEASWGRRCIRDAEAKELAEAKIAKAARDVEQIVTGRITGGSDADNLYQCRKIAAGIYCDLTGEEFDEQAIAKAGSHE